MREFFRNAKEKICGAATKVRNVFCAKTMQTKVLIAENRAENFVDSGIKILIAVVIGALLLGGLYALFGDTILPTLTDRVEEMFDFKG